MIVSDRQVLGGGCGLACEPQSVGGAAGVEVEFARMNCWFDQSRRSAGNARRAGSRLTTTSRPRGLRLDQGGHYDGCDRLAEVTEWEQEAPR